MTRSGSPGESRSARDDDGSHLRQLERERCNNDQKLKARFEHLFRKYEHDFTGVGDEIDLHSCDIVVNNGHLQHMRHEVDPGTGASTRFVRTFQEKLHKEDEGLSDDDDDDDDESGDGGDDGEDNGDDQDDDSSTEDSASEQLSTRCQTYTAVTSNQPALLQAFGSLKRPAPRLARILIDEGTPQHPIDLTRNPEADESSSQDSVSETSAVTSKMLERVPGIQNSMHPLKASKKRPTVDRDAIQALGVSIANQLAQLMAEPVRKRKKKPENSNKDRPNNIDPTWLYPELDRRPSPAKRRRSPSPVSLPPISSPISCSPGEESLWAPKGSFRPSKRRRQGQIPADHLPTSSHHGSTPVASLLDRSMISSSGGRSCSGDVRRCWNCSLTNPSSWHKGPHGQDLCSSCGKYYKIHRRMKPFDSPTPSVEQEGGHGEESNAADEVDLLVQSDGELNVQTSQPPCEPADNSRGNEQDKRDVKQKDFEIKLEADTKEVELKTPVMQYPANTSRLLADTHSASLEQTSWTSQEDALIIKLKDHAKVSWPVIAQHFPDKNLYAVQSRYSDRLRNGKSAGRELLREHPNQVQRLLTNQAEFDLGADHAWNQGQDKMLLELRDTRELSWTEIADLLPGHTAKAVAERYRLLKDGILRRQDQTIVAIDSRAYLRWTAEEDALIVRLREIEGLTWNEIAKRFAGRTMSTVQKRYSSTLAPRTRKLRSTLPHDPVRGTIEDRILAVDPELAVNISEDKYDPAEDALMKQLREQQQLDWTNIAARMPGHSAKSLEHRYEYMSAQAGLPLDIPSEPNLPANRYMPSGALMSCFLASTSTTETTHPLGVSCHRQDYHQEVFRLPGFQSDSPSSAGSLESQKYRFRYCNSTSSASNAGRLESTPSVPNPVYDKPRTPQMLSGVKSRSRQEALSSKLNPPTAIFVSKSTPISVRMGFLKNPKTPLREVDSDEDELA